MCLEEILNQNPFSSEVIENWRNDLEDFNRGRRRLETLNFTLGEDLNRLRGRARENLHTELIPKPFMGNPNAPVWYLTINPSFSTIDRYDDLGIIPDNIPSEWLDGDKNDKIAARTNRQGILLKQLSFTNNGSFTFLEEAFNTLGDCANCRDNGGYRWWRRRLFGTKHTNADYLLRTAGVGMDAASVGSKLFALESFPYHSKRFNVNYYTETKYFNFWKILVKWGLENGKKFIIRARNNTFDNLISAAKLKFNDMNSVSLAGQSAWVTRRNLNGNEETLNSIRELLRG